MLFHDERIAKNTYVENTCEVLESSYYESTCSVGGRFGGTNPCFIPVWMVVYSVVEETRINATIEYMSQGSAEDAQTIVDQYQVSATKGQGLFWRKRFLILF